MRLERLYRRINFLKRRYIKRPFYRLTRGRRRKASGKRKIKTLLKQKPGERYILLNPGPVLTTPTVKSSLVQYDLCHRDEAFSEMMERMHENALKVFDADSRHTVLFISGSGTSSMEAMVSSILGAKDKTLVLSNGAFGERMQELLDHHDIPYKHLQWEWGEEIDLRKVEEAMKKERFKALAVTHHETSVGLMNPIRELGKLAKKHDLLFLVDAISSLGGEPISMRKDNMDACISSSNKCLHGITGLSMVCIRKELIRSLKDKKAGTFYLDLYKHHTYYEERRQTPYTPNVTSFFALDQALKELLGEGLEKRQEQYRQFNQFLREELTRLGFTFFTETGNESNAILTVKPPEGKTFQELYEALRDYGFYVYPCKPPLAPDYFQIANMGDLNEAMLYDFIFALEKVLQE